MSLSPVYLEIAKGISIFSVIAGHSLAAVINDMPVLEQLLFSYLGKSMVPAVFCLIYLFGYGQGLKRKRVTTRMNLERIVDMVKPYLFWATLSLLIYTVSDSRVTYPYTGREIFGYEITPLSFVLSILTFSGSWQYYFLFILILFQYFTGILRNVHPELYPKLLRRAFIFQTTVLAILSVSLWVIPQEKIPLLSLGALLYPNPLLWFFPFFWGYLRSASRKPVFPSFGKRGVYGYLILLALTGTEAFLFVRRWQTYFVIDQFSVFTFFLSIFALSCIGSVSHRLEKRWHSLRARKETLPRPLREKLGVGVLSIFIRFGRFSFVLFLTHQPFMWFFLVWFEEAIGYRFSRSVEFLLMIFFGILFCWGIIKLSDFLPKSIRRFVIGF
ncbi:MAG TPA: acyltransferase family protein [Thermotogota bacterium]|nr:acyltransferase family protein [Thermotogota bacterium]NLH20031.1 acyltransferase [Thermotogaceae bacterium]OQC32384.1 MAG: Acyltransferase family protein [Thermotogota bacterium ADurb.Bin062]HNW47105.1 acyltransferase family protein [Thermotogota bacterium]HNY82104.1 acyltransferase family protein [Thermotogota bacterium]